MNTMNNYLEPRQMIAALLRWWWVLVIVTAIGVGIGYVFTQSQIPVYKATATIMVGEFIQAPQISRDDIVAREAYSQAYAEMARRQPVLDGVVKSLGLSMSWRELGEVVAVEVVENTPLIEISAKANNPQNAQAIAGEIANQLILLSQPQENETFTQQFVQLEIESVQTRIMEGRESLANLQLQLTSIRAPEQVEALKLEIDTLEKYIMDWEDTYARLISINEANTSQNSLTVIEDAQAIPTPVSPRLYLNLLLGVSAGFGMGIGLIFLIDLFDDRIRTGKALEQQLGLNHLGTIKKLKGRKYDGKLIATQDPLFGTALFYRKILKNIGINDKKERPVKSMVVTSPRLREGKSITVSNLGIVMAQAGFKTIIVDVDWKKPVQHQIFSIPNETGLMDLLNTPDLITNEQLQVVGVPNLQVLPTGNLPEDPSEILQPDRMKQILSDLSKISDMVILDAPSTAISESAVLFSLVDGVILVIDSNRTTMTSVKKSMTSLYLTGGNLMGGILNRAPSWGVS
jgi:capsular exopolysaccharide synthesis family protein